VLHISLRVLLFFLPAVLSDPSQICTASINTDTAIHIRTANPDSLVFIGCMNRPPIQCSYYSVYRVFQCRTFDSPCSNPRFAVVDGQCCDIGNGCPDLSQPTSQQPATSSQPTVSPSTSGQITSGGEPRPIPPDPFVKIAELEAKCAALESRTYSLEVLIKQQSNSIDYLTLQHNALRPLIESAPLLDALLQAIRNPPTESHPTAPPRNPDPTNPITPPTNPTSGQSDPTVPVELETEEQVIAQAKRQQQQQQTGITVLSVMIALGALGILCILVAVVLYRRRRARALSLRE